MRAYHEALAIIATTAKNRAPETERLPLAAATGRVCAESLTSARAIQPFDNSAMDGYAVRLADLAAATPSRPVPLAKAGTIAAGEDTASLAIAPGTCWHVMTGAPLPAHAEAIVPIENTTTDGASILFTAAPAPGEHIRRAGEDFQKGAPLLAPGDKITPAHILPLATVGIAAATVHRKPRILFIPTGTEIIDDLAAPLGPGQIYNGNKYYAAAFLESCGADVTLHDIIRDDQAAFVETIKNLAPAAYDIVISTGAVSMGSFDFIKDGLAESGAALIYHKLKLKPGKPNLFATLPCGALYFGLPGNPVAAAVGLRFFVAEALRVMHGRKPEPPAYARAANGFTKKPGLHMILKGRRTHDEEGRATVTILDGQESFRVSPFLEMNCWLHVPEDSDGIAPGTLVETHPLYI